MTKNYCDHCKNEIIDKKYVRVSFMGPVSIKPWFVGDNIYLCEQCYWNVKEKMESIIGNNIQGVLTSA
jgi:hypothetical protein